MSRRRYIALKVILLILLMSFLANATCPTNVDTELEEMNKGLIDVAAVMGLVMIVVQGLRWLTSETPEDRINAKQGITYVIIGLLIASLAYAIIDALYCSILCARYPGICGPSSPSITCPKDQAGNQIEVFCEDYHNQADCQSDPCNVKHGGSGICEWKTIEDKVGCHANCESIGDKDNCIKLNGCNWYRKWITGSEYCARCAPDTLCDKYEDQERCEGNPCVVSGKCIWCKDACYPDSDKDGVVDNKDNCPSVYNPGQENTLCDAKSYSGGIPDCSSVTCDKEGDACDDTDADGIIDTEEAKITSIYNINPPLNARDRDSNDNCITDGSEYGFLPIENILKDIAVAVGAVFIVLQGIRWLMSEDPSERQNAKFAIIYIVAGLIILAAGREIVIWIMAYECTPMPLRGCPCPSECTAVPSCDSGGSCPYVYSFDGLGYYMEHEGYPYSVLKPWEDTSYAVLKHLTAVDGSYRIKLSEELQETSYTNSIELWAVDHPQDSEVYPDTTGGLHTVENLIKPEKCVEEDGTDCTEFMEADERYWISSLDDKKLEDTNGDLTVDSYNPDDMHDGIILTFPKPENATKAKLLIRVKESGAVSYTWKKFLNMIGKNNVDMLLRYENDPLWKSMLTSWKDNEGMYHVRLWDGKKWVNALDVGVGAENGSYVLVPLELYDTPDVRVKLDSVLFAYETDYAFIDYTPDREVNVTRLKPVSAGVDYDLSSVLADDDKYLELPYSQQVEFVFPTVENTGGGRTYVVAVRGYFREYVQTNVEHNIETVGNIIRFVSEPDYATRYGILRFSKGICG